MKGRSLPNLWSLHELANLLDEDESVLRRLYARGIHPPWIWRKTWKEPRFSESAIPEWQQILESIDLSSGLRRRTIVRFRASDLVGLEESGSHRERHDVN